MSSKYRVVTNPSLGLTEFQVGDLVKTRDTFYTDSVYGWLSPGELGIVQEVRFFEITDYFNVSQSVHQICELQIFWPRSETTTFSIDTAIIKIDMPEEEENGDL